MNAAKKRYAEDLQDQVNILLGKISEAKLLVREAKESGRYTFVKLDIEPLIQGLKDLRYQAIEDPRFIALMETLMKETDEGKVEWSGSVGWARCVRGEDHVALLEYGGGGKYSAMLSEGPEDEVVSIGTRATDPSFKIISSLYKKAIATIPNYEG